MRIVIKEKDSKKPIIICIPTRFICNSLTAAVAGKIISKHLNADLATRQCVKLARAINKARADLHKRHEPFVEVIEADGDSVRIKL